MRSSLLLLFDDGFANDNRLLNGGFETAGGGAPDFWANWVEDAGDGAIANETTEVHEGSNAAKLTGGSAPTYTPNIYNAFTVVPEKTDRLRLWTRGDGANAGRYTLYDVTNSTSIVNKATTGITGTSYAFFSVIFTNPAGCVQVRLILLAPNVNGGIAYFDACEIQSGK